MRASRAGPTRARADRATRSRPRASFAAVTFAAPPRHSSRRADAGATAGAAPADRDVFVLNETRDNGRPERGLVLTPARDFAGVVTVNVTSARPSRHRARRRRTRTSVVLDVAAVADAPRIAPRAARAARRARRAGVGRRRARRRDGRRRRDRAQRHGRLGGARRVRRRAVRRCRRRTPSADGAAARRRAALLRGRGGHAVPAGVRRRRERRERDVDLGRRAPALHEFVTFAAAERVRAADHRGGRRVAVRALRAPAARARGRRPWRATTRARGATGVHRLAPARDLAGPFNVSLVAPRASGGVAQSRSRSRSAQRRARAPADGRAARESRGAQPVAPAPAPLSARAVAANEGDTLALPRANATALDADGSEGLDARAARRRALRGAHVRPARGTRGGSADVRSSACTSRGREALLRARPRVRPGARGTCVYDLDGVAVHATCDPRAAAREWDERRRSTPPTAPTWYQYTLFRARAAAARRPRRARSPTAKARFARAVAACALRATMPTHWSGDVALRYVATRRTPPTPCCASKIGRRRAAWRNDTATVVARVGELAPVATRPALALDAGARSRRAARSSSRTGGARRRCRRSRRARFVDDDGSEIRGLPCARCATSRARSSAC